MYILSKAHKQKMVINTFLKLHVTFELIYCIIESVDSISRNGPGIYVYVIHYIWPKNIRSGKLLGFLTFIIIISSKFCI